MEEERDQELEDTYYFPKDPGSYGGIERLKASTSKTRDQVVDFLKRQKTYQLHKQPRRRFKRRRYIVSGIDDLWQADLADMSNLSQDNNGVTFLLVVIDVFSKYLWVRPLKAKTATVTLDAIDDIMMTAERKPRNFQTDKGTEFMNQQAKVYFNNMGVNFYQTQNIETKAAVAERVIRTLKGRLYKYLTSNDTKRYIDVLQDTVYSYNHSKHRSIGMKPADVTEANSRQVKAKLYEKMDLNPPEYKFSHGDKVRITVAGSHFRKGYLPQWTQEVFIVNKQKDTVPPTYRIKDQAGELISGSFYEPEMQLVPS